MAMTKKEQMELKVAKMRVQECEEKIAVLFGDKPTDTFMSDILSSKFKDYPLLPNADIKFKIGEHGGNIQARIRKGVLEIMGDSAIQISPIAANCIEIKLKHKAAPDMYEACKAAMKGTVGWGESIKQALAKAEGK